MKRFRVALSSLFAGAIVMLASCSDSSPLAPLTPAADSSSIMQAGLLGRVLANVGALECRALPAAAATKVIGPDGGVIEVGEHTLEIPRGALTRRVSITASSPSGSKAHVQFAPHGLTFERPVKLTMSYAHCGLLGSLAPKRIAYTDGRLVNVLEYLLSVDNLLQKEVSTKLDHFSDYVIFW
jgi:hypothetical protein